MTMFNGKVALVTGAGSGLGEATAKDLAADINLAAAERVAGEIGESN